MVASCGSTTLPPTKTLPRTMRRFLAWRRTALPRRSGRCYLDLHMATYLESGWYDPRSGRALRTEVIDGAMDVAGVLLRAGIAPAQVQQIALKVRGYVTFADPHMTGG